MHKTLFSNLISNSSQTLRRVTTKTALAITLAMAALSIALSPVAHAAPNSNKNTNTPANVVAHVAVAGGSATRMLLIKRNGKEYLILGLDSSAQIAVVDVSDPRRPQNLDAATPAPGKPATELNIIADTLSVFGKYDAATVASADPKELRNISGVTVFLVDNTHGLIYAANKDGLWIVKTQRQAAEDAHADYYGG